jgi:methylmalonyl-CoA mutase cobalamin-binding domain/chain
MPNLIFGIPARVRAEATHLMKQNRTRLGLRFALPSGLDRAASALVPLTRHSSTRELSSCFFGDFKQRCKEEVAMGQKSGTIRVLIAKVGLDGHDRGVKVVARTLRDAGMDVIYTGLHRTPEEVVEAAVQEDVDVIGVSILSGAHMTVFSRIVKSLKERGSDDILVVGGGVIPDDEVAQLKTMGVAEIMLQDTPPEAIVAMVRRVVAERGAR